MRNLTCPRCEQLYSVKFFEHAGTLRHPLLLHCGHTFCLVCIQKLKKDENVKCPTCQATTNIGEGGGLYKTVKPDIYTIGCMWAKRMNLEIQSQKISGKSIIKGKRKEVRPKGGAAEETVIHCGECRVSPAVCQCVKCDGVMCSSCFEKIHQKSYTLQKHKPVGLIRSSAAVSQGDQRVIRPRRTEPRTCPTHDQCRIEYYCDDDKLPICSRCVILGDHKGHKVQTMEDKNKVLLADMEPSILETQETLWRLEKSEKLLKEGMQLCQPDMELANNIREHFSNLHSHLQAREEQLLEDVKKASHTTAQAFQEMRDHLQNERLNLEEALIDAARAKKGNVYRLVDADLILERLQKAKDLACVITVHKDAVTFPHRFSVEPNLRDTIKQYGNVSVADSLQMFTLTPAGPEAGKPPAEELRSYSVDDVEVESLSTTDSASVNGSASVGGDKNDTESGEELSAAAKVTEAQPVSFPPVKQLVVGDWEVVNVTHICTPVHFYVQLASQEEELEALQHNINRYCHSVSGRKAVLKSVEIGSMVFAQYPEDNQWYRSQVLRIVSPPDANRNNGIYQVCFVDYGNSSELPFKKLRKMPKHFLNHPIFAHECALSDILPADEKKGWTRESVDTMVQMTFGGSLHMKVMQKVGGRFEVDLGKMDKEAAMVAGCPVSVRDSLVFLEMAIFNARSPHGPMGEMKKRDYLAHSCLFEGMVMNIGINWIHSPSFFYAQVLGLSETNKVVSPLQLYDKQAHRHTHQLLTAMQQIYSRSTQHLYRIFCPKIGMICVARYPKDNNWYRARVTRLPGHRSVEVQYVDYGNSEVVSHNDICKILDDHIKYPMQAHRVTLADVEPLDSDEWSEEARNWFRSVADLQLCQFRVTTRSDEPNTLLGVLYTFNSQTTQLSCINYELVKRGYAKSTGPWSQEESFEGISLDPEFQIVMDFQRSSSSSDSSIASPKLGTYHFSSPGASKSSIIHKKSPKTRSKPPHSAPTPVGPVSPPAESTEKRVHRQPWHSSEELGVGESWERSDDLIAVMIAGYTSPSHFCIQQQDREAEMSLSRLMAEMQTYERALPWKPSWKVGDCCAAKTFHDNRWYRGLVLRCRSQENTLEVKLVDFGHIDVLPPDNLRPLKTVHAKPCFFAERCHIAGLLPSGTTDSSKWSQTATEFMKNMLQYDVFMKLKGPKVPMLGLPVDLIAQTDIPPTALEPPCSKFTSIAVKLEDEGLGIPFKTASEPGVDSWTPSNVGLFTERFSVPFEDLSSEEEEDDNNEDINEPVSEENPESGEVAIEPDLVVAPHPSPPSTQLQVMPLHVDSEGIIYAQEFKEAEVFRDLTVALQKYCEEEASDTQEGKLKVGQFCLAFCTDHQIWLRAQVLKVQQKHVEVRFIDYGKTARVNAAKMLRPMTAEWCSQHQLVYQFKLNEDNPVIQGGPKTPKEVELLKNSIINKHLIAVIQGSTEERPLVVDLHEKINIDDSEFVDESSEQSMDVFYEWSSSITNILKLPSPYASLKLGQKGEVIHALITHLELPNVVFIQRCDSPSDGQLPQDLIDFAELMEDLNNLPPQTPSLEELPTPGHMCSACYRVDNRWYRGLVVKTFPKEKLIHVLYVDYGNSEIIHLSRLRVLPARFQSTPAQGVRALLNLTLPQDYHRWTMSTYKTMASCIYNIKHRVLVKETMPLTVELYQREGEMTLAYADLIHEGLVVVPQQDEDPCIEVTGERSSSEEGSTTSETPDEQEQD